VVDLDTVSVRYDVSEGGIIEGDLGGGVGGSVEVLQKS